jgi:hypothetical protein
MFRAILILGLLLGAGAAAAADGYYSNPARDIEFSNVQHLGRSPRILMPTLYVKFARWGRVPLSVAGSATGGAVVDVDAPVPVDALRDLAGRLQEDLANQLKTAGWDVLTETDVKDNPIWTKLERVSPDKRFGVPFEQGNVAGNPRRYLIVAPANLPVIAAGSTGPAWTMKDLVAELNATVLVATYTFDVIPSVPADAASSTQPVAPRLQLLDVNFDFRTPGMVGGTIRAKIPQTSTETTGKFSVPGVKEEKRAQALQETAAGKGKGELMLEPDAASLITTALSVGVGFNVQAVTTISAFAPK